MTSFSNVDRVVVSHYSMVWAVAFDTPSFTATAELTLLPLGGDPPLEIVLDTLDLTVTSAEMMIKDAWQPAAFRYSFCEHRYHRDLGSALHICTRDGVPRKLRLRYHSTSPLSLMQWKPSSSIACVFLPNYLTCRRVMPMQDTFAARFTYDVTIALPRGTTCVMPATTVTVVDEVGMQRQWVHWKMTQSLPLGSHQFFFAIGTWEVAQVTPSLRVWGKLGSHESLGQYHEDCLREATSVLGVPIVGLF